MQASSEDRIYLDHAATTPLHPAALAAMEAWADCGNPNTLYAEGRAARQAIDEAREVVTWKLRCEFAELIFTSGGTEAATLAIIGCALANREGPRRRVLLGAAEHHCVLNTADLLEALGYAVELVPVDRSARTDPEALRSALGEDVLLVSLMHANNELGTINPIRECAELAHSVGAQLHCDAVQSFCKEHWSVVDLGADLVSISAHKIGGPKGVGALYIRAGTSIAPVIPGGGQERELRAGTENVAAIAGFGAAVESASDSKEGIGRVRDILIERLNPLGAVRTVPADVPALEGHAHLRFPGVSAESMLILLDRLGVSAGSGAACSSGSIEPSHVLLACGFSEPEAKEGLRFTLGPETAETEVVKASNIIETALARLRRAS